MANGKKFKVTFTDDDTGQTVDYTVSGSDLVDGQLSGALKTELEQRAIKHFASPKPVETTASDVARQVGKGLSFGWSPEIEAGVRAPFSDQSYDQIANQIRARNKAYEAANPLESFGMQLGGGLLTGGAGAARVATLKAIQQAPRLARYAATYPGVGLVEGTLAGSGYAPPGEKIPGAVSGGALGTTLGMAAPLVIGGIGKLAAPVVSRLSDKMANRAAQRVVARNLARDKMTKEQGLEAMQEMGEDAALIDVGPNISAMGEAVANRPGAALEKAVNFVETRRGNQPTRVFNALKNAVGSPGVSVKLTEDSGAFQSALNKMVPFTDELKELMNRPAMRDAWGEAQVTARNKGIELDDFDVVLADAQSRPEVQTHLLHLLKKGLDDVIEPKRGPSGQLATEYGENRLRSMQELRTKFRKLAGDLNPNYDKVLKESFEDKKLGSAFDFGEKFALKPSVSPDDLNIRVAGMGDAEIRALRTGTIKKLEQLIGGRAELGQDITSAILRHKNKLDIIFGDRSDDLIKTIRNERAFALNEGRLLGNSRTALRQEAQRDLDSAVSQEVAGAMGDVAIGNTPSIINRLGRGISNFATRPPEAVGTRAAQILFESNPELVRQLLAGAPRTQGGLGAFAFGTAVPQIMPQKYK